MCDHSTVRTKSYKHPNVEWIDLSDETAKNHHFSNKFSVFCWFFNPSERGLGEDEDEGNSLLKKIAQVLEDKKGDCHKPFYRNYRASDWHCKYATNERTDFCEPIRMVKKLLFVFNLHDFKTLHLSCTACPSKSRSRRMLCPPRSFVLKNCVIFKWFKCHNFKLPPAKIVDSFIEMLLQLYIFKRKRGRKTNFTKFL